MKMLIEFLDTIANEGVKLSVEGGQIHCHAPRGVLTPAMRQEITRHRAEIITLLERRKPRPGIQEESELHERVREFPLSAGQKGLFILQKLYPGMSAYNVPACFRFKGNLDAALLARAWDSVLDRYPILTAKVAERDGALYQLLDPACRTTIRRESASFADREEMLAFLKARAKQPFFAETGPLTRIELFDTGDSEALLLLTIHHLVIDGLSAMIVLRSFFETYQQLLESAPMRPQPELPGYEQFVTWEEMMLASPEGQGHAAYWRKQLEGELPVLELVQDRLNSAPATFEGETISARLTAELSQWVREYGRAHTVPASVLFLAALQLLLYKYTEQQDVIVGMPVMGRAGQKFLADVGYFINMVPLRSRCEPQRKLGDFLRQVQATTMDALFHSNYPFPLMLEALQIKEVRKNPVFQVTYAFQSFLGADTFAFAAQSGNLEIVNVPEIVQEGESDLGLEVFDEGAAFSFKLKYNPALYSERSIRRLLDCYCALIEEISKDSDRPLGDYSIVSSSERQRVLVEFNETAAEYPTGRCLHDLFVDRVAIQPGTTAVVCSGRELTYQQLYDRSSDLALYLQDAGVRPGDLVALCMDRSVDMLVGLLGILQSGGAYVPLDPNYPEERLGYTLEDSRAAVVLTQESLREKLCAIVKADTRVLSLDAQRKEIEARVAQLKSNGVSLRRDVTPEHLAYVIYTSGSTGKPKGVAIEHHSPVTLVYWALDLYSRDELKGVLASTSICFDLSVFEMFVTLAGGGTVIIVPNALGLFELANRDSVTLINTVPSAMEELVRLGAIPDSVLTVNLAGEPLPARLVDKVYEGGRVGKVYDLYGPSEDTTYSTFVLRRKYGPQTIGRPIANTRVYILDPQKNVLPIGVPGELYIAGDGLARGYLHRPELTQEKFVANPFEPGGRMYRTGDRARWLDDGNIQYLGRIDTQVKIRGFRIEIGEIEVRLGEHAEIQDCAVVAQGEGAAKQLVAFYRAKGTTADRVVVLESRELRTHLLQHLPDYMIPAAFVSLPAIPLNPNGKVDRRALMRMDVKITSGQGRVAPRNDTEQRLALLWAEVLNLPADAIGVNDNFFEMGGHSLLVTQLISRIHGQFGVDLPLKTVFDRTSIAQLAESIEKAERSEIPPIVPIDRAHYERLPLSFAEERVWFMHQLVPEGATVYSVPGAFVFRGELNLDHLNEAYNLIIQRHEALRTIFPIEDGRTYRHILDHMEFRFRFEDLSALEQEARDAAAKEICLEDARTQFDLTTGPLIRGNVIRLAEHVHIVMINMHHIVSDGWSIGVLVREFRTIMEALRLGQRPDLPPLPIQYGDYAVWQRQWLKEGGALERQLGYWRRKLAGLPESLDLATDLTRPSVLGFKGKTLLFSMDGQLVADLKRLAERQGATLYMVLLAAFKALLYRYTGQSDICLGSMIANRNYAATEGLIGMFVNTQALRTQMDGEASFLDLLARVRITCLEAYENQDAPFPAIVEAMQLRRNTAVSPLFQILFFLQSVGFDELDQKTQRYFLDTGYAKYEISVELVETAEGLNGSFEFNTELFVPQTIARMIEHFVAMCRAIVADPSVKVCELPYVGDKEKHEVLIELNASRAAHADRCLHELFTDRVAHCAEKTAVVCGQERLTYRELYDRSRDLALYLQGEGVEPDFVVAVCMNRSVDLIVAMMAVLQAGGAYVPLDPSYPDERLAYMMRDSAVGIVLTETALEQKLRPLSQPGARLVPLDGWRTEIAARVAAAKAAGTSLRQDVRPDHLAYVIYTSGSTGAPKGVAIEHHSPVALANWAGDAYSAEELAGVLASTSVCFDLSVFEIFVTLANGGTIILAPNALSLLDLPERDSVTLINTVPSAMEELLRLNAIPASVRTINLAGEPLSSLLVERIYDATTAGKVYDLYGPSETTTYSTFALRTKGGPQTIGRPIAHTQIYVLDEHRQPQPLGVPGEIYIAGAGVARGYLHRPELTGERFVDNPFEPGTRMYRTGDRARWLHDGTLQYLGRIDTQVKVRGFRIELGEIEARLNEIDGIADSAVVAQGEGADKRLVAFYQAVGTTAEHIVEVPQDRLRATLAQSLPDFMIPAAFASVTAIPLTANGKVDRRLLERTDVKVVSGREYVAPRNATERQLVAIFAELLALPPQAVGIHDSFFELGGNSLTAVQMISRINTRLNESIPLLAMFTNTSIAAFAKLISSRDRAALDILVSIQPDGDALPIFGIPGAGGSALALQALSRTLGKNQPFHALQAVGLDGKAAPLDSVEATAEANLAAVKSVQAQGPYRFIGHSYGGIVAYEMTRMLLERGEEVASLVLLDTVAPWIGQMEAPKDAAGELVEVYDALASVVGVSTTIDEEDLRRSDDATNVRRLVALLHEQGHRIPEDQFTAFREVYRANLRGYRTYKPSPLPRPVDVSLYRATQGDPLLQILPDDYGWNYLLTRPIRVHDIHATHQDIVEKVRFDVPGREVASESVARFDGTSAAAARPEERPSAKAAARSGASAVNLAKGGARERLNMAQRDLVALSRRIHAHPELGFEEERASTWVAEALSAAGFDVAKGVYDLPTALIARAGSGPLHIAICAEYDALPGIGHACGHNLISAMAVGAALAAARVADDVGLTVTVIGTPAEEIGDGGGKILLLERGAFRGVHAAMMVHPSPLDVADVPVAATATFDVRYTGKEAHAAAFPELGINAADALTIAQTAIGLLRQHIRPTDRVHGITTLGGLAPNIVPAHTCARYMVRAETLDQLDEIRTKVLRCFEAGALATGSRLEITGGNKPYAHMAHDVDLLAAYRHNAEALGRLFPDLGPIRQRVAAATDMGNISQVLPSIHPMIGIGSLPAVNHQPEFTEHCVTETAENAIMDGALAMAWTAIDIASDPAVRERFMARSPH